MALCTVAGMLIVGGSVYIIASPAGPVQVEVDGGRPPPVPVVDHDPPPSPVRDAGPAPSVIGPAPDADAELGACCRAGAEALCEDARKFPVSDGLPCRTCQAGEKRALDPKREWSMWLQRIENGPRIVPCARLGEREVCAGVTLGTQQSRGLRVTIEDIHQGRLIFRLVAPQQVGEEIPDVEGPAHIEGALGSRMLLSPALCEGVTLHVTVSDEAGSRDVAVKVFLVRPRADDVR